MPLLGTLYYIAADFGVKIKPAARVKNLGRGEKVYYNRQCRGY